MDKDEKSFGFAFLSFLIPLVGLILWLVWRKELPKKASSCGTGAIVGVVTAIALKIIISIVGFSLFSMFI